MAWIRVDDQMIDHPKIEPLSDAAFRWVHRGLSYANRFLTNGVLPAVFVSKVPAACVQELTAIVAGQKNPIWCLSSDGQAVIHDFKDYQPSRVEVERERKKNRVRQAKWRAAHNGKRNAVTNEVTNTVTNAVINAAPARPGPTPIKEPPIVPQGGRSQRRRRGLREVPPANPAAVDQAIETHRRRAEMAQRGLSEAEIEAVFEREYQERKAVS